MSHVATHTPLDQAQRAATAVVELLAPFCDRIEIAGSVRRQKAMVGDLEIVAVPKIGDVQQRGQMFPTPCNLLHNFTDETVASGTGNLRRPTGDVVRWGKRYRTLAFHHGKRWHRVDLFMVCDTQGEPQPERFGSVFVIRTGDSEFSTLLVTSRSEGGAMPTGFRHANGRIEQYRAAGDWRPCYVPDEQAFFEIVGVPMIPPRERTAKTLKGILRR